ncbi:hypothetical protein [Cytobacillus firmus]|nr:hypothetical protein [Cytobacillus firmus]
MNIHSTFIFAYMIDISESRVLNTDNIFRLPPYLSFEQRIVYQERDYKL